MINNPLVSVIVPAYNHEKYVEDLIDSIVSQSYANIELLICDDSSTDQTYSKILGRKKELEKRFVRIQILKNDENLGVVKNINKMLKLSQGKYIKIIASDDMLLQDGIKDLVTYYESHQEYDMIFSNCIICSEKDHYPLVNNNYKVGYSRIPNLSENVFQRLFESNFILGSTIFALRKTYDIFGFFDESFSIEDWEYCLRIAKLGKIGFYNNKTVAYRIVCNSQSHYTQDYNGKIRFRRMYKNVIGIHKKYNCSELNLRRGYSKVYTVLLHAAINSDDIKYVYHIFKQKRKFELHFGLEIYLKYLLYRLHLLPIIHIIKKSIGVGDRWS